jgi:hypothetical protein
MILTLILHGTEALESEHPRILTLLARDSDVLESPGHRRELGQAGCARAVRFIGSGLRCCLATLPLRPRIVLADPIDTHGERG